MRRDGDTPAVENGGSTSAPPAAAATTPLDFGANLYRRLAEQPGNLAISPVSLSTALGLVAQGAQGETRSAMDRTLGQTGDTGATQRNLTAPREGATLTIANALWVQQGFALKPPFVAAARNTYQAQVTSLDFRGAPATAVSTINRWVADRTANRITDLMTRDAINDATRLVVTNAVYFLADWQTPFNVGATRPQTFYVNGGVGQDVAMMSAKLWVHYDSRSGIAAIDLPYKDDTLVMTILLPDTRDGLPAIERRLDGAMLADRFAALDRQEPRQVRVSLPKFEARASYQLVQPLTDLGMGVAFTDSADLTGIADAGLRVSQVVHKTFVKVDETGTEAAAATGIAVEVTSAPLNPPPVFTADHPFLYAIRDRQTGVVLFLGRMTDPRG